jgi:hypothetical protein
LLVYIASQGNYVDKRNPPLGLEDLDEVEKTPSNDGIVVQDDIERHNSTADTNTAEVW